MRTLAVVETNFEDLAQFTVFSMIFVIEISELTIESIAVNVLKVVVLVALLAYILLRIAKKLSRFILRIGVSSKYLLLLSIALLYSAIMQGIELLTLLGSFIAGVVLSEYIGDEELTLMLGVGELGLLIYFSSLGSQLALQQLTLNTFVTGLAIDVCTMLTRTIAILLGLAMGAIDPVHIQPYATALFVC